MANRKIEIEDHQTREPQGFPCQCGQTFDTAQEFSDHVHSAHLDK